MNINTAIDGLGLPRNFAERMSPGSSIVVTLQPDGSNVEIELRAAPRGPGRPPKTAISD